MIVGVNLDKITIRFVATIQLIRAILLFHLFLVLPKFTQSVQDGPGIPPSMMDPILPGLLQGILMAFAGLLVFAVLMRGINARRLIGIECIVSSLVYLGLVGLTQSSWDLFETGLLIGISIVQGVLVLGLEISERLDYSPHEGSTDQSN